MHKAVNYRFFTYRLLPIKGFDDRPLTQRQLPENLPSALYGPIYIAPKGVIPFIGSTDKVSVVIRDPRAIITSWYDSLIKTHAKMGNVDEMRNSLLQADEEKGMTLVIDHALNFGTFEAMESWLDTAEHDSRVKIIRFETIFSPKQTSELQAMLEHFDMPFDPHALNLALEQNSFESLAKKNSHYKEGKKRKWQNRLTEDQVRRIASYCPKTASAYEF